ncbi:hypothetical protein MGALJ_59400 [Mycobacterium gallinarum]|uniref:Uncharacterized protein n=1 Tax=Mycobacterium gallinarum TaxID=39689 RepID=A0A9W4B8X7_9MYCO|nr:hypothetical protein MGALJ_59400 [Mycobacterium gallinarum]
MKPALGEEFPGGLLDSLPGLATLGTEGFGWHGHIPALNDRACNLTASFGRHFRHAVTAET